MSTIDKNADNEEDVKAFNYIDSVNLTVAMKFARFVFQDSYVDAVKNADKRTFDIFVTPDVDMDMVNYWKEYFGKSYRFLKVEKTELNK